MMPTSFFYCCKKVIYGYENMNDWKNYSNTSLPQKEDFYSDLNVEDIIDADYTHAKRIC